VFTIHAADTHITYNMLLAWVLTTSATTACDITGVALANFTIYNANVNLNKNYFTQSAANVAVVNP